jgi:hypothetical protein
MMTRQPQLGFEPDQRRNCICRTSPKPSLDWKPLFDMNLNICVDIERR